MAKTAIKTSVYVNSSRKTTNYEEDSDDSDTDDGKNVLDESYFENKPPDHPIDLTKVEIISKRTSEDSISPIEKDDLFLTNPSSSTRTVPTCNSSNINNTRSAANSILSVQNMLKSYTAEPTLSSGSKVPSNNHYPSSTSKPSGFHPELASSSTILDHFKVNRTHNTVPTIFDPIRVKSNNPPPVPTGNSSRDVIANYQQPFNGTSSMPTNDIHVLEQNSQNLNNVIFVEEHQGVNGTLIRNQPASLPHSPSNNSRSNDNWFVSFFGCCSSCCL